LGRFKIYKNFLIIERTNQTIQMSCSNRQANYGTQWNSSYNGSAQLNPQANYGTQWNSSYNGSAQLNPQANYGTQWNSSYNGSAQFSPQSMRRQILSQQTQFSPSYGQINQSNASDSEIFQYQISSSNLNVDEIKNKLANYGITNVQVSRNGNMNTLTVSIQNPNQLQMQGIKQVLLAENKNIFQPITTELNQLNQLSLGYPLQALPSVPYNPLTYSM
jgi:hypothetical protein